MHLNIKILWVLFWDVRASGLISSSLTWSLSSWTLGSEFGLWDTRIGGWGARLFFGVSVGLVGELSGDKFVLGRAMLSGRGLLTSTGEAGALAVVGFKEQISNQNMIRGLFPNNIVHVNQWQTKVNKPPSESYFLMQLYLHNHCIKKFCITWSEFFLLFLNLLKRPLFSFSFWFLSLPGMTAPGKKTL